MVYFQTKYQTDSFSLGGDKMKRKYFSFVLVVLISLFAIAFPLVGCKQNTQPTTSETTVETTAATTSASSGETSTETSSGTTSETTAETTSAATS